MFDVVVVCCVCGSGCSAAVVAVPVGVVCVGFYSCWCLLLLAFIIVGGFFCLLSLLVVAVVGISCHCCLWLFAVVSVCCCLSL